MFCKFEIAILLSLRERICSPKEFASLRILNLLLKEFLLRIFCQAVWTMALLSLVKVIGVLLVFLKPDGKFCMCTDYRKAKSVTKTDSFPVPRIDNCNDNIGRAKYVTKFNLLKGFWQIPLTVRAKENSDFVTPAGLYHTKLCPLERLISKIITWIRQL